MQYIVYLLFYRDISSKFSLVKLTPIRFFGKLPLCTSKLVNDEKTLKREISAFKRINDNYPKYLLTLDYDNANIDGIQKLNVIDWLLG